MYLGVDYGRKRIGLALGREIPKGIGTINNPGSFSHLAKQIVELSAKNEVKKIIVGLPAMPSGDESELTSEVYRLAGEIKKISEIDVVLEEEAYTSVSAEEELKERGISPRKNKQMVDELSAIILLEQYINSNKD